MEKLEDLRTAMFFRSSLVMAMVEARRRYANKPELLVEIVTRCTRQIKQSFNDLASQ